LGFSSISGTFVLCGQWHGAEAHMPMEYVTSSDGTRIAYERTGSGPPLVLVHGSLNDHNAWGAVAPMFASTRSVYAVVRRGRGESGPLSSDHTLARECDDVRAVIEAIGHPVDLIGHSYGAHCALGAALMLPDQVKHLVLYEPPAQDAGAGVAEDFQHSEPDEAIARFFEHSIGMSGDQVSLLRASPFWAYFVGHAKTMPHEMRALTSHEFDPASCRRLTMPTLLLMGSETQERLGVFARRIQPYVPDARVLVLDGQGHAAMRMAPELFAGAVTTFLST
jgi:pimeloyl-ACP methyl ester carboxylesterase